MQDGGGGWDLGVERRSGDGELGLGFTHGTVVIYINKFITTLYFPKDVREDEGKVAGCLKILLQMRLATYI